MRRQLITLCCYCRTHLLKRQKQTAQCLHQVCCFMAIELPAKCSTYRHWSELWIIVGLPGLMFMWSTPIFSTLPYISNLCSPDNPQFEWTAFIWRRMNVTQRNSLKVNWMSAAELIQNIHGCWLINPSSAVEAFSNFYFFVLDGNHLQFTCSVREF